MKSITIHGMDPALDGAVRKKAQQLGLSLNKTIKQLLAAALGIDLQAGQNRKAGFADLCGAWSREDLIEFDNASADLRKIDPEDW